MKELCVRKWAEEFWLNEQNQKGQDGGRWGVEKKTPSSPQIKVAP